MVTPQREAPAPEPEVIDHESEAESVGQQAEDADPMPPLHSPRYDFNDGTLETGIRLMTRLALEG